jgi:hypothetical protein
MPWLWPWSRLPLEEVATWRSLPRVALGSWMWGSGVKCVRGGELLGRDPAPLVGCSWWQWGANETSDCWGPRRLGTPGDRAAPRLTSSPASRVGAVSSTRCCCCWAELSMCCCQWPAWTPKMPLPSERGHLGRRAPPHPPSCCASMGLPAGRGCWWARASWARQTHSRRGLALANASPPTYLVWVAVVAPRRRGRLVRAGWGEKRR